MKYPLETEISLGFNCNYTEETIDCSGTVDLTEEEVKCLIDLIRDNNGETDVIALGLEEKYPELYEKLDEAYQEAAREANFRDWLLTGYRCGYFEKPEGFMESVEAAGLFKYEPDLEEIRDINGLGEDADEEELNACIEEDKEYCFEEWLPEYYDSLDENGKVGFIESFYGDVMEQGEPGDFDYTVEIPQCIIDLANN